MTLLESPENIVLALDPPLSGTMNPGDAMALWLVGETAVLESGREAVIRFSIHERTREPVQ